MNFFFYLNQTNKKSFVSQTKRIAFSPLQINMRARDVYFLQLFFIADIVGSKRIPVSKFGLDLIKYSFIWLDEKFDTIRNPNSNTSSFFVSQYLMGPNSFRSVFFFSWYRSFSCSIQSNATYAFYILLNKFEHSIFVDSNWNLRSNAPARRFTWFVTNFQLSIPIWSIPMYESSGI